MNKLVAVIVAASLGLNAVLLALLALGFREPAAPAVAAVKPTRAAAATAPIIDATVWPSLQRGGDLPSLVASLREAGFPPAMVRAIVSAQINEQFAARRKALDPDADSRPFWKSTNDAKLIEAQRQFSREHQKMMRDLLGKDALADDPLSRAREGRMFGHLPPEKLDEARRIVREFNELRSDVFMSLSGGGGIITITAAYSEKLNALDKQMNAELAKIMTPSEFEDYELRGSNTATSLHYQLAAFDVTESEFRMLFQLQKAFDARFPQRYGPSSQEQMRLRTEAQQQLNQQIKAALGPVRAAEYERATNYEYRTASQLVARLELPPETTNQLWTIREETMKRVTDLRQGQGTPSPQLTEQLKALQQEATTRIAPLLGGAHRVEVYKQYGGQWLGSLVPRPPPPGSPRPRS